ncbi:PASTA domain-containing protein [Devriesea agamarum]|uniref:PASTA domain-containing protein n=1 Tax=Devriesea agamarum TaxID=472569 RepID=UPI00071E10D4|nr:PASTA domain-containing protein [Devriesea agamarum]
MKVSSGESQPNAEPTAARVVPDVSGMTKSQATKALRQAGYNVSGSVTSPSDSVRKWAVTGTQPAAGTALAPGSSVTLVQSSGPARGTQEGQVAGGPSDEAMARVEEAEGLDD